MRFAWIGLISLSSTDLSWAPTWVVQIQRARPERALENFQKSAISTTWWLDPTATGPERPEAPPRKPNSRSAEAPLFPPFPSFFPTTMWSVRRVLWFFISVFGEVQDDRGRLGWLQYVVVYEHTVVGRKRWHALVTYQKPRPWWSSQRTSSRTSTRLMNACFTLDLHLIISRCTA